ncbi:hypothetical protein DZA28_13995 [Pseudomonas alloputida]|jgi:hypothetical protein|uniref:Uncharacterized protein n=1 Tax=Pseudomonas alloputida TaxID=1940621 RepID=A0ABY3D5V0_9PSED|nr:hypothetical protein C1X74_08505 [Pseudomonas sp. GW460-5]PNB55960.1 hypothetical protein C1X73_20580 [Pseudomonas sp. FW305-130]TRZ60986.1 hypothetical protein DZA28_13995 [Pseudomonas alloputida]
MCGACGVLLGATEWADALALDIPLQAQRHRRIAIVNRLLSVSGTRLYDAGSKMVLHDFTGRTRVVDDLAHIWIAAAELGTRPVDPLSGF